MHDAQAVCDFLTDNVLALARYSTTVERHGKTVGADPQAMSRLSTKGRLKIVELEPWQHQMDVFGLGL
ncbi:hypothetical protein D3C76_1513160 [compost metagenome]